MPILQKNWKDVVLPVSKAKCKIGIAFGDALEIQNASIKGLKVMIDETGKAVTKQDFDGSVLQEKAKILLMRGIKDWDFTNEVGERLDVTWENISNLENKDAIFLQEKISQLLESVAEDRKKK